jgi:hypothetical protein
VKSTLLTLSILWPLACFCSRGIGYFECVLRSTTMGLDTPQQYVIRGAVWGVSLALAMFGPMVMVVLIKTTQPR